jgi:TRAP-type C4-dicarboxylate transport system substrate-binding protein
MRPAILATLTALLIAPVAAQAQSLKISHSWPETADEYRHGAALQISESLARHGIQSEVFGNQRLMRAREQWQALKDGTVDIAIAQLSDAVPQIKEFEIFAMPGLAKSLDHAMRLPSSPAMSRFVDDVFKTHGIMIGAFFPQSLVVASAKECAAVPTAVDGKSVRGVGNSFNLLIEDAGGTPVPIPQPEIAQALRTGALDAFLTSTASMISGRYQNEMKCVVSPGRGMPGALLVSVLVSGRALERAGDKAPQLLAALRDGARFAYDRSVRSDAEAAAAYRAAGVKIHEMTAEEGAAWRTASEKSAMAAFARISPTAAELIRSSLSIP